MRRLCAVALSILLALGWLTSPLVSAPAEAVTPARPGASPGHPVRGVAFIVAGRLPTKVARPVQLQRKSGGKWIKIADATTSSQGRYSFSTTSAFSQTQLRVYAPKVKIKKKTYSRLTSRVRTVNTVSVTPTSPMPGETFTVVESLGKKGARPATLQRKSGRRWIGIQTVRTSSGGTATFTASLASSASLRVYAPKTKIKKKKYRSITVASFSVTTSAQSGSLRMPGTGIAGQALVAQAQFSPARAGRSVTLQQLNGSQWVTVATSTQDASGKATLGVSPSAPGTFSYRATTSDFHGAPATSTATTRAVVASGVPEPSIVIGSLDSAVTGETYHTGLNVVGGTAPFTWSATGLPDGLSLSGDGVVSGTPTKPGTYQVTFTVTDASGKTAHNDTTLVVEPVVGIDTETLPAGIADQDYSATMAASGGTTPYHWTAEGLPAGLSISDDGVISGTTDTTAEASVTVTVTDGKSRTATKEFTLTTTAALALTTDSVPAGTVGASYSASLAATGGASPYSWSQTGLPAGLSLNATTGEISGTPTEAGTFDDVMVTVTDDNGYTATTSYSLVIAAAFAISTTALPSGVVGTTYPDTTMTTVAGTAPFTWSQTGLPAGLSLDASTGVISGTPTEAGTFNEVSISVSDSASHTTQASFTVTVAPAVHITTTSLPAGVVGTAYPETTLAAADGNSGSVFWAADHLPEGLSFNGNTGVLSGVPTTAGSFDTVTFTVTDEAGKTAEATYTITIAPAVHIITTTLPGGVVGTAYTTTTLTAADGNSDSYTWASTTLPDGLSLSSSGKITGTPTSSGVYENVKITVADADGKTAETTYSVTIDQAVHITTASLPGGVLGVAYSTTTLTAAGGTPYYNWHCDTLPAGLTLSGDGLLAGKPTSAGVYDNVKITATDHNGKTAEATFSITIAPAVHITTTELPNGIAGTSYPATTLTAADGGGSYHWRSESLPAGLSINSDTGALSGTPNAAGGPIQVTITVSDDAGTSDEKSFQITIAPAVHITTTTLPSGVVGTSYSATVEAADGAPAYGWTSTTLPDGLSVDATTGKISGTPTHAGTFGGVKITATDRNGATAEATYTIAVAEAIHITTTTLPSGVVGTDYSATVEAADGAPGYGWTSTGLPGGLVLNSSTGEITGNPSEVGTFDAVKITATDRNGAKAEAAFSITIAPAVHITTDLLSDAVVNEAYPETTLAAAGGTGPYTWSATGLPAGVEVNSTTGVLSGTPTESGSFDAVKVTVTDANHKTAEANFSFTVHAELAITTAALPTAVIGEQYSVTLAGLGGNTPYTWAVTNLPDGLTLDSSTGAIAGTPTTVGSADLGVTLTDSHSRTATTTLSVTVRAAVHATMATIPDGVVGTEYSGSISAGGGTAPYSWTSTTLPAGLLLSPGGVLSGTPTVAGVTPVTLTVTDAHGTQASTDISLTIAPAVHITTTELPGGVVDTTYPDIQLTAEDGNSGDYSWTSSTLPAGLSLSTGGKITGTPTTAGTFDAVKITVTDHAGKTAEATFTMVVAPAVHITMTSLPDANLGESYSVNLDAADGTAPYSWLVDNLPEGLGFDPWGGTISGTPTQAGTFDNIEITVTDARLKTATATFSVTVLPAVHVTTATLPSVEAQDAYPATTLEAAGGTAPYSWTVDTLPAGLTLTNGVIEGTPTTAGTTTVTATVTDAHSQTATAELTITVTEAAHLTNTALSIGVIGGDYTTTLTASGGTAPYTITAAALPDGLALTGDTISGTPTTAVLNTPVEFTITDGRSKVTTTTLALTVAKPVTESSGSAYACAITPTGGVECWGNNTTGQLGDGTTTNSLYPVKVSGLDGTVISIATGVNHTCALLNSGEIQCWGYNNYGQLGNNTGDPSSTPVDVVDIDNAISITSGQTFSCATLSNGTATCWGIGTFGQLGNGGLVSVNHPVAVNDLTGVMDVQAGLSHACAVTTTGSVSCWGRNNLRQLGVGVATSTSSTPVAVPDVSGVIDVSAHAGNHTCVSTDAGAVKCWGANGASQLGTTPATSVAAASTVSDVTDATQVAVGLNHSCAITSTGAVRCWGGNTYGQLGTNASGTMSASSFAIDLGATAASASAGANFTCARTTTGTVMCWGYNYNGQLANGYAGVTPHPLTIPALSSGFSTIAVGDGFSCGLTTGGGVKCWGGNSDGQLGDGTTTNSIQPVQVSGLDSGVATIDVGTNRACALTTSGGVKCWGNNSDGALGIDTLVDSSVPVTPVGLSEGVVSVSTADRSTCAVLTDGTARCWGENGAYQLGDGSTTTRTVPVPVFNLTDAASISVGAFHACAITTSGGLKCWGGNGNGTVGDGTTTAAPYPVNVSGLSSGVTAVTAGSQTTCAVVNSAVQCWGYNPFGQVGDGTTTDVLAPITVPGLSSGMADVRTGTYHVCALATSGAVSCWGLNSSNQLGDGTMIERHTPTPVVGLSGAASSISVGGSSSCTMLTDGTVQCWGSNTNGQLGIRTAYDPTPAPVIGLNVAALDAGTASLPGGVAGTAYASGPLTATGGVAPYTWTATGLPAGLSVSSAGVLSGTPTAAGTTEVTFTVTDARGKTATTTASITITPAVHITSDALPNGAVGAAYEVQLEAADGSGGYTWSSDILPAGLSLSSSGVLSGTPTTQSASAPAQVTVTDEVGGTATQTYTIQITAPIEAVAMVAKGGGSNSCALTSNGGVECWGLNDHGQLGNGTTTNAVSPVPVSGLSSGVVSVVSGGSHSCALTTSGGVKCWGRNNLGQVGNQTFDDQRSPVDVFGLTSGVVAIGAGVNHSCAVLTTGAVTCWGYNPAGQLGDGTLTNSNAPVATAITSGATQVVGGAAFTCVLVGGGVKCWGNSTYGQLGDGTGTSSLTPVAVSGLTSGVTSLSAYAQGACVVTNAGGAKCWGLNGTGQLGNGTTNTAFAPVDVTGLSSGVTQVAVGSTHACALTTAGAVTCWGNNNSGQLGDGTLNTSTTPVASGLSSGVRRVSAGAQRSCAVLTTGGLKCWGAGESGQLGDGSTPVSNPNPVDVFGYGATPVSITTTSVPSGAIGSAYTGATLAATGGTGPYTWTAWGLPTGLSLSSAGVLSGTPTAVGSWPDVTVWVADSAGNRSATTFTMTVSPALSITTSSLAEGMVNSTYTNPAMVAAGGDGTYSWTATNLPAGITLSTAGAFGGKPTASGTKSVVFTVTDGGGATAQVTLTLKVVAALAITTSSLSGGIQGSPYSGPNMAATGGTTPYTWSASGLPSSISLSSAGVWSGTCPEYITSSPVTVTVTDAAGRKATKSYTMFFQAPAGG